MSHFRSSHHLGWALVSCWVSLCGACWVGGHPLFGLRSLLSLHNMYSYITCIPGQHTTHTPQTTPRTPSSHSTAFAVAVWGAMRFAWRVGLTSGGLGLSSAKPTWCCCSGRRERLPPPLSTLDSWPRPFLAYVFRPASFPRRQPASMTAVDPPCGLWGGHAVRHRAHVFFKAASTSHFLGPFRSDDSTSACLYSFALTPPTHTHIHR